jgi:hypothetical protein
MFASDGGWPAFAAFAKAGTNAASRFSTRDRRPHRSHLYKERKGRPAPRLFRLMLKSAIVSYKMGWIGTAAFQALDGDKELVFDLADGLAVPSEFKEGDDIDIVLHPAHPAMIAMDMNNGYYEVIHLKSGVKFEVPHKTSEWRFKK